MAGIQERPRRSGLTVAARHGPTRVKLAAGEVRFYPDGVVWANLGGLEMKPLVADAALAQGAAGQARAGVEELKLKGGAELLVKHLVVLTPPDPPESPLTPAGGRAGPGRQDPGSGDAGIAPARDSGSRSSDPATAARSPGSAAAATGLRRTRTRSSTGTPNCGLPALDRYRRAVGRGVRAQSPAAGATKARTWAAPRARLARPGRHRQAAGDTRLRPRRRRLHSSPTRPGPAISRPPNWNSPTLPATCSTALLGGEARVVLADPIRFDLWLTATDVQLDEIAQHYKLGSDADLKGIAQAQLRLFNRPDPKTGQPGRPREPARSTCRPGGCTTCRSFSIW